MSQVSRRLENKSPPTAQGERRAGAIAARHGLLASLLAGLGFCALFPPFTIADEPAHFYRAYLLSEGRLHVTTGTGRTGAVLPMSLSAAVDRSLVGLVREPDVRFSGERWREIWSTRLEPERRTFLEFPTSGMLPFLAYLPQAVGIAIGRSVSAPPVALLYLGRLTNLIVASWLVATALRILPGWRWALLLVALSPTALSARASLSPDALTFALALSTAAWVLRSAVESRPRAPMRGAVTAVGLCLTKLPYVPLLLAALPRLRDRQDQRWFALLGVVLVVLSPPIVYSSWCAARVDQPLRADLPVDRHAQVERALSEPGHFLASAGRTLVRQGPRLLADLCGARLGWLDVQVPRAAPWLLGLTFLVLIVLDRPLAGEVRALDSLAFAAAILASLLAIALSQYATWTSPSDHLVRGLQGRYFLPLAPFLVGLSGALPAGGARRSTVPRATMLVAWTATALAGSVAMIAVYLRFWGP